MKKKKPRKPDAAEEIVKGTLAVDRKRLAARIRSAINVAVRADRKERKR